jgi:GntR family transcriptional regulator
VQVVKRLGHQRTLRTSNPLPSNIRFESVYLYPISDTVSIVIFRLQAAIGQPLYLQLMQQIRHAVETGALQNGDQLPGIRTLAEELVVSPNTVAKAYSELEHEGLLELRHGSGAFVLVSRRTRHLADRLQSARRIVGDVIEELRESGLIDEEIRRMFEAELLNRAVETVRKR